MVGYVVTGEIIEHASGKKFQDVLDVEGKLYIGIPPGVESRLAASVAMDTYDLSKLDPKANPASATFLPSSLTLITVSNLIELLNTLDGRCAIVPEANGHLSARAVARYYAALVDGSVVRLAILPSTMKTKRVQLTRWTLQVYNLC
ncbi:putative beta-lactamase/transpeptidase [Helianthus annuus]|nr:putative beta-lactamase/transpeptidase [Helianthus annuus]